MTRLELVRLIMPQYFFYMDDAGDIRYTKTLWSKVSYNWNPDEVADHWKALVEYVAKLLDDLNADDNTYYKFVYLIKKRDIEALMKLAMELSDE